MRGTVADPARTGNREGFVFAPRLADMLGDDARRRGNQMFEAMGDRIARSSNGTLVEVLDDALRYRVGDRTLIAPIEYVFPESLVVLYAPSIRTWEVPDALEAIGSIEREKILADLSAALTVLGVKHRIER
jgi:hypothetical protein